VREHAGGALPDLANADVVPAHRDAPEIFATPLSPDEALGNITALLSLPHARAVSELEGFLDSYAHVVGDVAVRGNLVPDGHVAAILFQHGVRTLYTNDRDFRKFESLDVKNPFA